MGNGAAIKRGARAASAEILVFMDADGQHDPVEIAGLLGRLGRGYDMIVGSRVYSGQASAGCSLPTRFYPWLARWTTGPRSDGRRVGAVWVRRDGAGWDESD